MNYEINDLFLSIFEIKSRNKKSPLSREGCTCTVLVYRLGGGLQERLMLYSYPNSFISIINIIIFSSCRLFL
nr:MAG TPA: hypothetical protein [Caudoviricetes sp.]